MANKKYAVWKLGEEDSTKEYIYAKTHREASKIYRARHPGLSVSDVDTRKW